jgi:ABC-type multidrug transport system ATPase subunit
MMQPVIRVQHLTRHYGKITAVNDLSFEVYPGQVFGLAGPNGSGKTTALSMILSLVKPNSGSIELFGSANLDAGRKRLGATLESAGFYPEFSGEKNLHIVSIIKGVPKEHIAAVLHTVGLEGRAHDAFKNYSMGMKQRLAIAAALLGAPDLVILDEPTNGLDPRGIVEIRELILKLAAQGKTILIASHLLDELEKVCTHIAIMQKGTLIKMAPLHELHQEYTSLEKAYMQLTV